MKIVQRLPLRSMAALGWSRSDYSSRITAHVMTRYDMVYMSKHELTSHGTCRSWLHDVRKTLSSLEEIVKI
jgi:hypothetical protein